MTSTPSEACVNEFYSLERDNQLVAQAERRLRDGQNPQAFRAANSAIRRLEGAEGRWYDNAGAIQQLKRRAEAILAMAVIRLDGAVTANRRRLRRSASDEQRAANLRWATEHLHGDLSTPEREARYAEGLAALGRADEAREILERLREADLMPDAWSFRVLAQLEHDAGHATARDRALGECQQRAGRRAGQICPEFDVAGAAPTEPTLS